MTTTEEKTINCEKEQKKSKRQRVRRMVVAHEILSAPLAFRSTLSKREELFHVR